MFPREVGVKSPQIKNLNFRLTPWNEKIWPPSPIPNTQSNTPLWKRHAFSFQGEQIVMSSRQGRDNQGKKKKNKVIYISKYIIYIIILNHSQNAGTLGMRKKREFGSVIEENTLLKKIIWYIDIDEKQTQFCFQVLTQNESILRGILSRLMHLLNIHSLLNSSKLVSYFF